MKVAMSAALLLTVAACSSYPDEQDPQSRLSSEIEKLRAEMKQLNAQQVMAYDQLSTNYKLQTELVTKLDLQLRSLQPELKVLQDQVKTLQAQAAAGPAPAHPAATPAKGEPTPALKVEDIQAEIEATLAGLSSSKLKREEAAALLKPHPTHAVPRILDEIQRSPTRFEYVKQLEFVLAQLSPKELKVFLREALEQRAARDSAARVIGMARDSELGRLVEPYAGTKDEDFRLLCGDSLVACRNAAGIPALVSCLKSDQSSTRTIAIAALKRVNRGESFGYSAPLSPEQNANAIKSWEEWAVKFGPTVFD
jgi:hypothetical protein